MHTKFTSLYVEGEVNYRLIYPESLDPVTVSKDMFGYRREYRFKSGEVFCIDLWERNNYGTRRWVVYVLQAGKAGEKLQLVPAVYPGAKILLKAQGKKRAQKALSLLKGKSLMCMSKKQISLIQYKTLKG